MSNKYTKQIIEKGTKFNSWIVIKEIKSLSGRKLLCVNSDGVKKNIRLCHLKSGASKGLSKNDLLKCHITHGMKGTRIYNIWQGIKRRCLKAYEPSYKNYGGRGILICNKWLKFEGFYDDMFSSYKDDLTIERIDNNGNYCKENCKWATRKEQMNNMRTNLVIEFRNKKYKLSELSKKFDINYNTLYGRLFIYNIPIEEALKNKLFIGSRNKKTSHFLTYKGETQTIKQWAIELNMKYITLFSRIKNGWDIKDALTIPVRNKKNS